MKSDDEIDVLTDNINESDDRLSDKNIHSALVTVFVLFVLIFLCGKILFF